MGDFQSMLLSVATNELTSHGVMLFAVLTSSFTFLRIINDYYKDKGDKIPIINNIILLLFLSSLFGTSLYVFIRLLYWARVLSSTIRIQQVPETSFAIYAGQVFHNATDSFQNIPHPRIKEFIIKILPTGRFPNMRVITRIWKISFCVSFVLIEALSDFSTIKWFLDVPTKIRELEKKIREIAKQLDC